MIAIIATFLIAATAQAQPPKSLLQQIVPNPTGVNGYEDYLRAADLIYPSQIGRYFNWTPDSYDQLLEATKPDPETGAPPAIDMADPKNKELLAFAKRLDGMTRLEVQREAVTKFGKALDLVAEGNRKRVWDPRTSIGPLTLFPEFSTFKSLAKLADFAAFVAFADGQSLRGTKYLLNSYQLGVNLESGTLISHLVGVAIQAISLLGIERHLDAISRADASAIEAAVPNLLSGRPRIMNALDVEQQYALSTLKEGLRGGETFEASLFGTDMADEATKALQAQIRSLTTSQRDALVERARRQIEMGLIPIRKRFTGPESGWISKAPVTVATGEEEEPPVPANPEAFVDMAVKSSTHLWDQVGMAYAKSRTQLRLLGLSASVIRYKWDHGKLPDALTDVVAAAKVKDPLSDGEFAYERQGAWGFRVFSKGAPGLGEIGLRYRRAASQDSGPSGPPPP